MFGLNVNYAPQPIGARIRFGAGMHVEGKILGESCAIYDTNVSGRFGDFFENFGGLLADPWRRTARPARAIGKPHRGSENAHTPHLGVIE